MSNPSPAGWGQLQQQVDKMCSQFEEEWKTGRRPRIEDYLEVITTEARPALLRHLLPVELEYRMEARDSLTVKEYQTRFTEYADVVARVFSESTYLLVFPKEIADVDATRDPTPTPPLDLTLDPSPGETLQPPPTAGPVFPGYDVLGQLGRGGMGEVYKVRDQRRDQIVALKVLPSRDPSALSLFKQEFRSLADITHPNLVTLYELVATNQKWFFTMELVEGVDFLSFVRWGHDTSTNAQSPEEPITHPDQFKRLYLGLRQLVAGILALHKVGKLHRDIKPSNVMVTPEERVVVLDFGLVGEVDVTGSVPNKSGEVMGTVAYMSPEQGQGKSAGPASDWYSVGVMLFLALTGRLPFMGSIMEVLNTKKRQEAPSLGELAPKSPIKLQQLCAALLKRSPTARPSGRNLRRRLGGKNTAVDLPATTRLEQSLFLIGREEQLQGLHQAFAGLGQGQSAVVLIQGNAGMGKSSLVYRFLDELQSKTKLLVLTGRCYEQESVPYKALDNLVDAVSGYLQSLSPEQLRTILPDDIHVLARLFPVLQQITPFAAASKQPVPADLHGLRKRAFLALRSLLTHLGRDRALVLSIDDLHWGDVDSAAALAELLRPPNPPRLVLLGCCRAENMATSPFLKAFAPVREQTGDAVVWQDIHVGPLSMPQAADLAVALLGRDDARTRGQAEHIARESAGNPLFIWELAHHLHENLASDQPKTPASDVSLEDVLWSRIRDLPAAARQFLEIVAVSGRPLPAPMLWTMTKVPGQERDLAILRTTRLLRGLTTDGAENFEVFHDRIRETIVSRLPTATRQQRHRSIAETMAGVDNTDAEFLAIHFAGAGETKQARTYTIVAAKEAAEKLAFDRAARLYEQALKLDPESDAERRHWQRQRGDALSNAGRGAKAADAYLAAIDEHQSHEALELRRRAADSLLRCGHVDQGLEIIRTVLRSIGLRMPRSTGTALVRVLLERAYLYFRGLDYHETPADSVPARKLLELDTCWSIAVGLSNIDVIRGLVFHMRHLRQALRLGELSRVSRAISGEVINSALAGGPNHERTERLFQLAFATAQRTGQPYSLGWCCLCSGAAVYLEGDWKRAKEVLEQGEQVLRDECAGVEWELHSTRFYLIRAYEFLGQWRDLGLRYPAWLQDAEERGDLYAATNLRVRVGFLDCLRQDQPEQAWQEMRDGMAAWKNQGVHLQHFFEIRAHSDIAHYEGKSLSAWNLIQKRWRSLERSLITRVQSNRLTMYELRSRAALALAADGGSDTLTLSKTFWQRLTDFVRQEAPALQQERHRDSVTILLHQAEQDARHMLRENIPWANGSAYVFLAGVAAQRGQRDLALQYLTEAETIFTATHMELFLHIARWRRGQLLEDAVGNRLIAKARQWMHEQTIRRPERLVAMYAPGIDGT